MFPPEVFALGGNRRAFTHMKRIAKGDLLRRIKLNRKRLASNMYCYPGVFGRNSSWPGDWDGRCILALTSLYFSLNGYPEEQKSVRQQLDEIMIHLKDHVNSEGYFGEILNGYYVNEQQISGNSWYLRGLIEYYQITKDETFLVLIKKFVNNFIYKISKFYSNYPLMNRELGGVDGHIEGRVTNGWLTSSDVGCAFIMLDGMSEAYYLLRDEKLKDIISEIIEVFMNIDFVSLKCQTHATLSCARGIFNFYQATKDEKYLTYVQDIFDKYVSLGMTKDYSNINWFKRPDTWTEPCCVVDSLILSGKLYEHTKDNKYLRLFNRIYLNSFRMSQRNNGGAGCNTCLIEDNHEVHGYLYEAFFCCTMRFAEGLRFAKKYFSLDREDGFSILTLTDQELILDDGRSLSIHGDIYQKGKVKLSFSNIKKQTNVSIYIPKTIRFRIRNVRYTYENEILRFVIDEDKTINISFELEIHHEEDLRFAGDMLLVKRETYLDKRVFLDNETPYYYVVDYSKVRGVKNSLDIKQEI